MMRKLLCAALLITAPTLAHAAGDSWGPRVGFSMEPNQFVFGGQYTFLDIAPDVSFSPNLEVGFGDHVTVVALNLDFRYHFQTQTTWEPYAGGGIAISFVSFDAPAPLEDDSDTQAGGTLIIGALAPPRGNGQLFTELKLGLGDVPDLKAIIGWNIKL